MSRSLLEALVMAAALLFPISACSPAEDRGNGRSAARDATEAPEPPAIAQPMPVLAEHDARDPAIALRRVPDNFARPAKTILPDEASPDDAALAVDAPTAPSLVETAVVVDEPAAAPSIAAEPDAVEPPAPSEPGSEAKVASADPNALADISAAAERSLLQLRLADLATQNEEMARRLKKLEEKVERLEDNTSHETLGFGLGLASGLKGAKGEYRLVMEANLRYVYACLYAKTGFCGGLAANLRIWDIQIHWIGAGVMYYGDYGDKGALSVPEFGRSMDLMLTSGLDWRVWEGLEIRAQVAWFIPPPGPIYEKAKERIEQAVDEIDLKDPNRRKPDTKAPKDAWGIVTDAYSRAFRSPYLVIGARWEF